VDDREVLINNIRNDLGISVNQVFTLEPLASSYLNDVYKVTTAKGVYCLKHTLHDEGEAERQYKSLRLVLADETVEAAEPIAVNAEKGLLYTKWIECQTLADYFTGSHVGREMVDSLHCQAGLFLANLHKVRSINKRPMDCEQRLEIIHDQVPIGTLAALDKIYSYLKNNQSNGVVDWAYGHGDYKFANLFMECDTLGSKMKTIDLDLSDERPVYYDMAAYFVNYLFLCIKNFDISSFMQLSHHMKLFINSYEKSAKAKLSWDIFRWVFLAQLYLRVGLVVRGGASPLKNIVYKVLLWYCFVNYRCH
jgi:Ser/Thr protein kinase RdoA (MazF antagonist)